MGTNHVGINFAKFRKLRGLTQEEMARKLGVSAQAISKWENGSYPDGALLPKISKLLNVSLDVLFGIKASDEPVEKPLEKSLIDELQKIPEEERIQRIMEICYSMVCSYYSCSAEYKNIPRRLNAETIGEVKTDSGLIRMRLNDDLQYFWALKIPEEGVNNYIKINSKMLELFKLLSQEDYLKVIYYLASSKRNFLMTRKKLVKVLKINEKRISEIIDKLDEIGIVWKLDIETDEKQEIVYGYTHNSAFVMLMAAAKAYTMYGEYREPVYENWTHGAFRAEGMNFVYKDDKNGGDNNEKI